VFLCDGISLCLVGETWYKQPSVTPAMSCGERMTRSIVGRVRGRSTHVGTLKEAPEGIEKERERERERETTLYRQPVQGYSLPLYGIGDSPHRIYSVDCSLGISLFPLFSPSVAFFFFLFFCSHEHDRDPAWSGSAGRVTLWGSPARHTFPVFCRLPFSPLKNMLGRLSECII
jgi:hypothetical protein